MARLRTPISNLSKSVRNVLTLVLMPPTSADKLTTVFSTALTLPSTLLIVSIVALKEPLTVSISVVTEIIRPSWTILGYETNMTVKYSIKPSIQIINMTIEISFNLLDNIKSTVRSKLVDIVMELEKEFDNLDDYDLSSQVEEDPHCWYNR